jgi:hypothetical protein
MDRRDRGRGFPNRANCRTKRGSTSVDEQHGRRLATPADDEELTVLRYQPGDLPAGLEIRNAEVTVFHMWDESCVGITAHDSEQGLLTLAPERVIRPVLWRAEDGPLEYARGHHSPRAVVP